MNITRQAIEKNRITITILVVLVLAGLQAYKNLPRAEDPGFTIRMAVVQTFYPGASPQRVEMLVTDKIEKAIQEMPELDFVTSQSRNGFSLIFVAFKQKYKHMRPIFDKLRRKVERVTPGLPEDIIGPIVDDEFGDVFGIIFTLTGEGYTYAELKDVADQVRNELLMVPDVAKVEIHGAQEERIFVEYNNARLTDLGISPYQLKMMLESRNIIIPGGEVFTDDEQIALEPSGNFESVEDLKRTIINIPGRKDLLYLGDIARVYRDYIDPPARIMRTSNVPCLGLAISMREGGNIITMGEAVKEKLDYLQSIYPIGIEFDTVAFQPDVVQKKVNEVVVSLLQSICIVTLVMLLFLGLRTGIVVATLIPMAMLSTLFLMRFLGIGMDQVSLSSLIIALGMLVDNAIVMSESIMVKIQNGSSRMDAAVESAKELRVPLLVASLTTSAAFLPIFLAKSGMGEYTGSIFKVVTLTLLCSWLLAITMTPMLCYMFIKIKSSKKQKTGADQHSSPIYRKYRSFLSLALRHRGLTVLAVILIFFIVMTAGGFVPVMFMPPSDKAIVNIQLEFPRGTPIEKTKKMVKQIDAFIEKELKAGEGREEGFVNWASFIGYGGTRFVLTYTPKLASPEYAFILGNTTSAEVIPEIAAKLEAFCMEKFPDLSASVKPLELGVPVGKPVVVRVQGREMDRLFAIVDEVKAKMEEIQGTKNIEDDWGFRTKKLVVDINQARARKAGVSNQDVALSLYTILSGLKVTEFREKEKVIPITLRTVAADRKDIGKLETIDVYSQLTGRSVPLKQIGDIRLQWEPSQILRKNRLLTVAVSTDLQPGVTAAEVNSELVPWLKEKSKDWELGYSFEVGGESEEADKANQAIGEQLPIAGLIILLLLILQFNSFRKTFIILVTIPLGVIGVIIGLLITGSYFGFMTLLGVVSLAGIVINNAIVMLDRIRIEIEEEGLSPREAVIEAAQLRFRPILLTTATTIGGLLPLWFGSGPMWEPMAIGIIFGLLFGTLLTLVVVPVLYSLLFKVKYT
ncbi:MAG: MMPL family transporter [Candidatus Aminicenantes bacterium]|nr:MMPL family transporter [Candidatus Aminicenantes bacterium]NIM81662.1 MMPL family transporter [Candidatus Aminicenantes bacterium]NIN21032.1 MMPL family transporter [Candidatus Aminicenantes bacterium]NIN44853.1 MMPL family transporter [Candidatus Aminicenantes bacterium]NIN87661.1 MMPL family transporter [Candidatus Aminicenantes bacterium]